MKMSRQDVIKALGVIGDMVFDLGSRLAFPVRTPLHLAESFEPDQKIVAGSSHYPVAEVALRLPEKLFPIKSFEDLIKKLEKFELKRFQAPELVKMLTAEKTLGWTLQRDRKVVEKRAQHFPMKMGDPENPPQIPKREPRAMKDPFPERTKLRERLGPLGDMILDLAEEIYFPVNDQIELSRQFDEGDTIRVGGDHYPIPQLALRVPDEMFPLKSLKDLVNKLVKRKINQVRPDQVGTLIQEPNDIRVRLRQDEHFLKHRAEMFPMELGGPERKPRQLRRLPNLPDREPERTALVKEMGPLGDVVLSIGERLAFPVNDPPDLAHNFTPEEALCLGPREYPLGQLSLLLPEEAFPLISLEDLVKKLVRIGLPDLTPDRLYDSLERLTETNIGYRNPYKEEELVRMAKQVEMKMGGPGQEPLAEPERQ
jgi:hypothetical protein